VPIEPWWETYPATTPRQELGMVSPELTGLRGSTSRRALALRPALGGMTPPRVDSQELVVLLTRLFWA